MSGKRCTASAVVAVLAVSVTVAAAPVQAVAAPQAPAAAPGEQVTLITGDVVTVGDGSPIVAIPRPGIDYYRYNKGDKHFFVPSDAEPAIRTGLVDESFFDVDYLVDNGYSDNARASLPLIASYTDNGKRLDAKALKGKTLPAARPTHTLDSVGAQAFDVDKGKARDLWSAVVSGKGGVRRLALDRKVTATLAESVPQVKAPQAWAAGYNGAGVKVAVLDTGADATHPDLTGRIATAASFVPAEQNNLDGNGHGTHVAATVAGTGAASGGQRKGVAPGAQLVIGKVLNSAGSGQESWIVDGMEWAATTGQAKVITMSLGGEPTDGSDTMSQAVNSLTAQTGALFVIAAGNSGPEPWTIGSPGAASSALTVGAVDKSDAVAAFSSRGPRLDGAVKPEVAAPGVGIVAARATGTSMGSPVDQHYTSANGTSMATPHVAGAAAILAQRRPTWTAAQLKAGVVGSADDLGKPANAQGSGRINVQRSIAATVLASPAAVGFGNIDPSATTNQTRTITYSNSGAAAVTLAFSSRFTTSTGAAAPAGALSLSHTSLVVPAGGTATLTVTANPNNLVQNVHYSGVVTATGTGVTVVTPIAATRTVVRTVTMRVIGFDGQPTFSNCGSQDGYCLTGTLFPVDSSTSRTYTIKATAAAVSTTVPAGVYSVDLRGNQYSDLDQVSASVMATKAQVVVSANQEIVFDLRTLKKITEQTSGPSTRVGADMYYQRTATSGAVRETSVWPSQHNNVYMNQTESVTLGSVDHQYQSTRIRSQLDIAVGSATWHPRYYNYSAVGGTGSLKWFTGQQQRTVVFGGAGDAAFFSGTSVQGKVVLIEHAAGDLLTVVNRAVAGGAAGVVAYRVNDVLLPMGNDGGTQIPVGYLTKAEGLAFKAALPGGSAQATVTGAPDMPQVYHLAFDTIPANTAFTAPNSALAPVSSSYHSETPNAVFSTSDGLRRNAASPMMSTTPGVAFRAPASRTDYYGPTTASLTWARRINGGGVLWSTGNVFDNPALVFTERWNRTPRRLGQAQWNLDVDGTGSYYFLSRQGNTFYPVPQLIDGHKTAVHGGMPRWPNGTSVQLGLKRNGTPVTSRVQDGMTLFDVPAASDSYEMSLKYQPNGTGAGVYRVESTYGFTSQQATQEESTPQYMCGLDRDPDATPDPAPCEVQKVAVIDYDIAVDTDNAVPVGAYRAAYFKLRSLKGSPTTTSMQVWISYNEGASWQALELSEVSAGNYGATLANPAVGTVSFKVTAADSAGSTITETLYNAYRIK